MKWWSHPVSAICFSHILHTAAPPCKWFSANEYKRMFSLALNIFCGCLPGKVQGGWQERSQHLPVLSAARDQRDPTCARGLPATEWGTATSKDCTVLSHTHTHADVYTCQVHTVLVHLGLVLPQMHTHTHNHITQTVTDIYICTHTQA